MSFDKPHDPADTPAPPWSPETETREEIKALLLLRRPLTAPEVALFRIVYVDIFDAYFDDVWRTLARWGVTGEPLRELAQETFLRLWDTTLAEGPPDVLLAKLRGLAMGLAWNVETREGRNPVTDRGAPSSGSQPGSNPQLDRRIDLKETARRLFHALAPKHQAVVDAIIFRDLTHEEAGLLLGLSTETVTKRWGVALGRLRELARELLSPSQRELS